MYIYIFFSRVGNGEGLNDWLRLTISLICSDFFLSFFFFFSETLNDTWKGEGRFRREMKMKGKCLIISRCSSRRDTRLFTWFFYSFLSISTNLLEKDTTTLSTILFSNFKLSLIPFYIKIQKIKKTVIREWLFTQLRSSSPPFSAWILNLSIFFSKKGKKEQEKDGTAGNLQVPPITKENIITLANFSFPPFIIHSAAYLEYTHTHTHTHTHMRNCRREKAAQRLAKRSISAKQIALPRGEPDKGARPPLHYNLIQESRRQDTAWTSISGWTRWLVKRREANVQLPPIPGLINSARLCATSSGR